MKGFRSFLLRGNVVDLAVGIVIGAAFSGVVAGFVKAFLTPVIGVISNSTGSFDSKFVTVSGVTFPYGQAITPLISFVLIAFFVYYFVVMPVNKLYARFQPKAEPDAKTKECPECLSTVPLAATRCSFCTIQLTPPQTQDVPQQVSR